MTTTPDKCPGGCGTGIVRISNGKTYWDCDSWRSSTGHFIQTVMCEKWSLRRQLDQAHVRLRRIASYCGHSDPTEACRLILAEIREAGL